MRWITVAITSMMTAMLGCAQSAEPLGEDSASTNTSENRADLAATPMSASECTNGANGFIDISDDATGHSTGRVFLYNGRYVELQWDYIRGIQRGWAKLGGDTRPGDMVWMDWTRDGGTSWIQCGPFVVNNPGRSYTSAAQRTNPSPYWKFRACGYFDNNYVRCTDPWW